MFARISILAAVASMASAVQLSAESAAHARLDAAAATAAALDTEAEQCTFYYTLADCSWHFEPKMNWRRFGYCWDDC